MLDELLKEIENLKTIKAEYKCLQKDKQRMSDLLYEYMIKEFNNKSYEDRVEEYKNTICVNCRYRGCSYAKELPVDILKPIESDIDFIPSTTTCRKCEWN